MTVNASADTIDPPAPANLEVTGQSPAGIDLAWDAVSDPTLHAYEVLRSDTAGGPYTEIGETTATTFSDTDVAEERDVLLRGCALSIRRSIAPATPTRWRRRRCVARSR